MSVKEKGPDVRFQQDIFWFEIAVDQPCILKHSEGVQ